MPVPSGAEVGGTIAKRYRLERRCGEGGFGEVWRARDTRDERPVAVKFLLEVRRRDARDRQRFETEARLLQRFDHPHIVRLRDVGEWEGRPFLVTEFVEEPPGQTLISRVWYAPKHASDGTYCAVRLMMPYFSARAPAHGVRIPPGTS